MIKSATEKFRKFFEQPVNKAIDTVAGLFSNEDQLSGDEKKLLSLIKAVLPADPVEIEKSCAKLRLRFERQKFNDRKIAYLMEFLQQVAPMSADEAAVMLRGYEPIPRREVIEKLLVLAIGYDDYRSEALAFIRKLAVDSGLTEDEFEHLSSSVKTASLNRSKILRSGTGIILALIVIGLFVLIATWLSSLLFGLALAYIFLPLEQYFERRLRRPPGKIGTALKRLVPVRKIRKHMKGDAAYALSEAEIRRREEQAVTTKATTLTVSCVVGCCLILLVSGGLLLNNYVSRLSEKYAGKTAAVQVDASVNGDLSVPNVSTAVETDKNIAVKTEAAPTVPPEGFWSRTKNKVRSWKWVRKMLPAKETVPPPEPPGLMDNVSNRLLAMLDNLKVRFQQLPLVQSILNELSDYLAEGQAEKHLTELLMRKSGGLFAFLGKFVAMFATFLLNILLTFFFFSLLLSKIAGFVNSRSGDSQATSYLIRTVFNGKWLPQMSEENLQDGDRIVGEVINKLRIWLRGYLTMIVIDFCVYTTAFTLLDVPYAPILGALAGVGILLPYIGPVSSALLTVLVTLAVGGADVTVVQIACIIGVYLIHNGVIEQFFIYPMIIGESLGLTTLETIIVVLLGGILAGIPGMIFALPTASVIKYLVPQIYRCWR